MGTDIFLSTLNRELMARKIDAGTFYFFILYMNSKYKNLKRRFFMPPPKKRIGSFYGDLEVLEFDQELQKFKCRCKCGNIVYRKGGDLRARIKNCGDKQKHNNGFNSTIIKIESDISTKKKYGNLVVIEYKGFYRNNESIYPCHFVECLCDCGNKKIVRYHDLVNFRVKSCGVSSDLHQNTAGNRMFLTKEKYYMRWKSMNDRCYNRARPNYKWYGGRKITVCDEWRQYPGERDKADLTYNNYKNYETWLDNELDRMNMTWNDLLALNYTVERIDDNGPYAPWNCMLANQSYQTNHQSTNQKIVYKGYTFTVTQLSYAMEYNLKSLYSALEVINYDFELFLSKHPIEKTKLDKYVFRHNQLPNFIKNIWDFLVQSDNTMNYNIVVHPTHEYCVGMEERLNPDNIVAAPDGKQYIRASFKRIK